MRATDPLDLTEPRYRDLSTRARTILANRRNLAKGYGQRRLEDPRAERELERVGYLPLEEERR